RRGPEDDGKRDEAAQHEAIAVRPGERVTVDGKPQAGVTAEQGLEGDPGFQPGQGRPQAVVSAVAESEVRPVVAADVQDVGGREAVWVAIGRAETDQYLFVRGDLHTAYGH